MSILEKLSIPQLLCNFDALFGFAFSTNYQTLICSIDYQYVRKLYTLRRKNTDTFASVCSKMAIFKRLENYLKDANFLIFSSITSCIDGKSFSMSFGSKIFTGTDFTTCQS